MTKRVTVSIGVAIAAIVVVAAFSGCAKAAATAEPNAIAEKPDPSGALYATVSSASFQLNTVAEALSESLTAIAGLKKDGASSQKALDSIEGLVNQAGETLSDFPVAPKGPQEVEKNPTHFERWEQDAALAADAALKDVLQAETVQSAFDPSGSQTVLREKLRTAEDGLHGAIETLSK